MSTSLIDRISDKITSWVGSTASLIFHTISFICAILTHWVFGVSYDSIFLVLTTVVSLEAIYISIFIQRAVNHQSLRLGEVEESIDDVEEALDDVEEALDDAEDSMDDIATDTVKKLEEPMDELLLEMQKLLKEFKSVVKESKKKD